MGEALEMVEEPGASEYVATRMGQEEIIFYWPYIDRELDKVTHIWSGHWTKDALRELTLNERFQLWGFGPPGEIRVFTFTQIVHFPAGIVLQIFLAFGNSVDRALPIMEATFERFAMETRCWSCEILGRPGWLKKLKGFKQDYVVMRRMVERQGVH